MKKQYTTPKIKVVDVNPSDIICTSPTVNFYNSSEEDYETGDMY